jgi:hypothetical protein
VKKIKRKTKTNNNNNNKHCMRNNNNFLVGLFWVENIEIKTVFVVLPVPHNVTYNNGNKTTNKPLGFYLLELLI